MHFCHHETDHETDHETMNPAESTPSASEQNRSDPEDGPNETAMTTPATQSGPDAESSPTPTGHSNPFKPAAQGQSAGPIFLSPGHHEHEEYGHLPGAPIPPWSLVNDTDHDHSGKLSGMHAGSMEELEALRNDTLRAAAEEEARAHTAHMQSHMAAASKKRPHSDIEPDPTQGLTGPGLHKARHRAIEQRRRDKINARISEIKTMLPPIYNATSERSSKAQVLEAAILYVQDIQNRLRLHGVRELVPEHAPAHVPSSSGSRSALGSGIGTGSLLGATSSLLGPAAAAAAAAANAGGTTASSSATKTPLTALPFPSQLMRMNGGQGLFSPQAIAALAKSSGLMTSVGAATTNTSTAPAATPTAAGAAEPGGKVPLTALAKSASSIPDKATLGSTLAPKPLSHPNSKRGGGDQMSHESAEHQSSALAAAAAVRAAAGYVAAAGDTQGTDTSGQYTNEILRLLLSAAGEGATSATPLMQHDGDGEMPTEVSEK